MDFPPSLLTSNDEPSLEEAAVVRQLLKELETAALDLDSDSQPQNARAHLEQDLQTRINLHKAILSPHRRLPAEVLHEIFTYLVPALRETSPDNSHLASLLIPWSLALVCRRWRSIALSIEELWSTLYIQLISPLLFPNIAQATVGRMTECFRRSGRAHLSFLLDMRRVSKEEINIAILECLLEQSDRWKTAHLQWGQSPETLTVLAKKDPHDFPALRNVRFSWMMFENSASRPGFPWSQLTRYAEENCSWMRMAHQWQALQQLTGVEHLRTEISGPHQHGLPVHFTRLRSASFNIIGLWQEPDAFLASLELPVLEALNLAMSDLGDGLLRSLPTYFPSLRILRLSGSDISMPEADFLGFLAALPTLEEFWSELSEAFSHRVLGRLTLSAHALPLLPNLRVLRIRNVSFGIDKVDVLVAMLRSRFAPPVLCSFEAQLLRHFDAAEVVKSVREMREQEGWDVQVVPEQSGSFWDVRLPGEVEGDGT